MIRPPGPMGALYSVPTYLRESSSMCWRASGPPTVSTTCPRTSDQSHGSSLAWMSTVIRGSGQVLRALPGRLGVDEQVLAVGVDPGGQRLGLAVRHQRHHGGQVLPLARRTVSSSSAIRVSFLFLLTCSRWPASAGPPFRRAVSRVVHGRRRWRTGVSRP